MTFGSLFAGIGGMDLGLERAGLTCKWQVEIDDYARRVLAKHWPNVRRHDDVRTFPVDDGTDWTVDLIAGGFPCQDISYSGKGVGITGKRSGLWSEFARIVHSLRPSYVLVENVAALRSRGMDTVLGELASCGYDAEWQSLPAAAFGAPHIRDRVFILAYANREPVPREECRLTDCQTEAMPSEAWQWERIRPHPGPVRRALPDPIGDGLEGLVISGPAAWATLGEYRTGCERGQWARDPANDAQSGVGRVAHGVPRRVDRLKGLGNAVVPCVAEWIGQGLMEAQS